MASMRFLSSRRERSRGQILPLFILFLTALLLMSSLLLDASMALLMRRNYQTAVDAAALAAANVIQSGSPTGCSLVYGPPPGAPRATVVAAAKASIAKNLPGYDLTKVVVTCPGGPDGKYDNNAVRVDLHGDSPGFFSKVAGIDSFAVNTYAVAMNGWTLGAKWSVVQLNPWQPTWGPQYNGCPSLQFSGGPDVEFDGSIHVDSKCPYPGEVGAMSANGNAATVKFNNNGYAFLAGGYDSTRPLNITPEPKTNQRQITDPLAGLTPPTSSAYGVATAKCPPAYSTTYASPGCLKGQTDVILHPGVYPGGIQLGNNQRIFLTPGVYIMKTGGFQLGASTAVYSVKSDFNFGGGSPSAWTDANWETQDCPPNTCGVMIYNYSWANVKDSITVAAGANLKLRAYKASAAVANTHGSVTNEPDWDNVLFWQARTPAPTSTSPQPPMSLSGGGTVFLTGTIYAPGAQVTMQGNPGGSGGDVTDLTIQFISWDLNISGASKFHFYYSSTLLAKPTYYGLVEFE